MPSEGRRASRQRLATVCAAAALVAVVLFCALSPIWEMDVFWHVAVGRWILAHHALPTANVWSAADPSQPYHPAQWAWEAAAAWLDRRAGLEGVRLANAAWITGTFALLYALLRRRETPAAALLISLACFAAFHDRVRVRPHVVNLTAEILLTFFVVTVERVRLVHVAAALGGFFVWGSLHAGGAWIGVALVAGVGFAVLVLERRAGAGPGREGLLLFALGAAVGCLLSPGSTAWLRVHEDAAIGYVEEWRAWPALVGGLDARLPERVLTRLFLPAAVAAFAAVAVRWRRARREGLALGPPRALLWAAACIVVGASAWRFFYFAALALIALRLGWLQIDRARGVAPAASRARLALALGAAALIATVTLHYECLDYPTLAEAWGSRRDTVDDRYFPAMGTQLLVESQLDARVATLPNWGGYVAYHGFPRLRTTIDGRFVAPDEVKAITRQMLAIYDSGQHTELLAELFDRLPADFLLVPRTRATARLALPSWAKVATGPVEDLWIRKTPGSAEWVHTLRLVVERHRLAGLAGHHMD